MASPDDTVCVWGGKRAVEFFFDGRDRMRAAAPRGASRSWRPLRHHCTRRTNRYRPRGDSEREWYALVLYRIRPEASRVRSPADPDFSAAGPQDLKIATDVVHLSVCIFMPTPFTSEASQPINDSCGTPATARSRSSATRAASVWELHSAISRVLSPTCQ